MAQRKVIWTTISENQLKEILLFFNNRNKSNKYAKKLYLQFKKELNTASKNPEIGLKTQLQDIRGLIISNYIIFY